MTVARAPRGANRTRFNLADSTRGVTGKGYLPVKPLKRSNERSERVGDAHLRSWERSGHNGSGIRSSYSTRQIATSAAANAPNRAKAAKSGRATRAPEEGEAAPLATAGTPHPACIMPVLQALHGRRVTRAPPSPNRADRADQRDTAEHTKARPRVRQRPHRQPRALAAASPGSSP